MADTTLFGDTIFQSKSTERPAGNTSLPRIAHEIIVRLETFAINNTQIHPSQFSVALGSTAQHSKSPGVISRVFFPLNRHLDTIQYFLNVLFFFKKQSVG